MKFNLLFKIIINKQKKKYKYLNNFYIQNFVDSKKNEKKNSKIKQFIDLIIF